MLTVEKLSYRRRHWLLKDASLHVQANEIVCLTGSNGAGKTTLLEIISEAVKPQHGNLNNTFKNQQRHWLGYLPDKAPLYPDLTVLDYLQLCAQLRTLSDPHAAVQRVLIACELERVQQQYCRDLSHGYRQRVGLAQAILHQPPLLILDEPSNGLDRRQRQKLTPLLRAQKAHSAILMTSHDLEEIIAVADRLYLLHQQALWEIPLPPRLPDQHWFYCEQAEAAEALSALLTAQQDGSWLRDGKTFACQKPSKALWQQLLDHDGWTHYPSYPTSALQDKLNHVESFIP